MKKEIANGILSFFLVLAMAMAGLFLIFGGNAPEPPTALRVVVDNQTSTTSLMAGWEEFSTISPGETWEFEIPEKDFWKINGDWSNLTTFLPNSRIEMSWEENDSVLKLRAEDLN